MQNGLVGEMKFANGLFETLETGSTGPARLLARPFVRLARLRFLEKVARLLDVQSGPRPRPATVPDARPAFWNVSSRLADMSIPGLERAIETSDMFLSALSATEIGVALRRYRLDRGSYPEDLSALSPSYLAAVPIDPFTGKPPVYARQGAGFTLRAESAKNAAPLKSSLDWTVEK